MGVRGFPCFHLWMAVLAVAAFAGARAYGNEVAVSQEVGVSPPGFSQVTDPNCFSNCPMYELANSPAAQRPTPGRSINTMFDAFGEGTGIGAFFGTASQNLGGGTVLDTTTTGVDVRLPTLPGGPSLIIGSGFVETRLTGGAPDRGMVQRFKVQMPIATRGNAVLRGEIGTQIITTRSGRSASFRAGLTGGMLTQGRPGASRRPDGGDARFASSAKASKP